MRLIVVFGFFCVWACILLQTIWDTQQEDKIKYLESNQCNCTVNINGSIVSVEDGFYYLIEGLSEDQVDEVQIMINNSIERK